jgi:hypothetical protein
MTNLFGVEEDSSEWDKMWNLLAAHDLNIGLADPYIANNNDDTWQYMSSEIKDGVAHHHFRHRLHPKTNDREVIEIAIAL